MTTALRQPQPIDSYVSDRVFDGVRMRDAEASARDRDRARKALERIRAASGERR